MYAYTSYLLLLWWLPFPFVAGGDGSNAFCFNHSNSFQFYGICFQGLLAAVPVRPPKYCMPFLIKVRLCILLILTLRMRAVIFPLN